jgi:hypothetical protein
MGDRSADDGFIIVKTIGGGSSSDIEGDIAELEARVVDIQSNLTIAETDMSNVQSNLVIMSSDFSNLESNLVIVTSDFSNLESNLVIVTSDTSNLESNLVIITSDISNIESNLIISASDMSNIQSNLVISASDMSNIQSNITISTLDMSNIQSNITIATLDMSNIQSNIDIATLDMSNLESNLVIVTSDISNIESNLVIITSDISNIESNLIISSSDMSNIQSNITIATLDMSNIQSNVDIATLDMSNIQSNITIATLDMSNIQSNVDIAILDMSNIQSNIDIVTLDMSNIQSNITIAQTDITIIEGNITVLEGNISVIESNITVLEGNITILEGNVSVLESNIIVLESDVSNIESNLSTIQSDFIGVHITYQNSNLDLNSEGNINLNTGANGNVFVDGVLLNNISGSGGGSSLDVLGDANIYIGDSTGTSQVAITGDITLSNTGVMELISISNSTTLVSDANINFNNNKGLYFGDSSKYLSYNGTDLNVVVDSGDINLIASGTGNKVDITGNLNVSDKITVDNLTVNTNLTVVGESTYLYSNITVIEDPVIELGSNSSTDDFDRGIKGVYHDGSAKESFFGWQRSSSNNHFTFIPDAAYSPSNVASGTPGLAKFGSLELLGGTEVTSTGVGGDLIVAGGSNINSNLYVGGNIYVGEELYINSLATGSRLTTLETSNTTIFGRVDTLETSNTTIFGRVDTLETSNTAIYGRVDTLETSNTAIYGRVDTLETSNTAIYGRVDTLETSNTAIYGRVSGLESNVSNIVLTGSNLDISSYGNINIDTTTGNIFLNGTDVNDLGGGGGSITGITYSDPHLILESGTSGNIVINAESNINLGTHTIISNTFSLTQRPNLNISGTQNITLNFNDSSDYYFTLASSASLTLNNPTNTARIGQQGSLIFKTAGTGHSLSWASGGKWYFNSGLAPGLTGTDGTVDIFSYIIVEENIVVVNDAVNFQQY